MTGFLDIRKVNDQPAPCSADMAAFNHAESVRERRGWLGHLTAVDFICDHCLDCPVRGACLEAAKTELYSGIAGGHVLDGGRVIT